MFRILLSLIITLSATLTSAALGQEQKPTSPDGVFFMPLEGGVGETIRAEDIREFGKAVDIHGPGQLIVLRLRTNGGLRMESDKIVEVIDDLRSRHRVIVWVQKAISAGCEIAIACDEIYFITEGVMGGVCTVPPGRYEECPSDVRQMIDDFAAFAKKNGYNPHLARAMRCTYDCSYSIDANTGERIIFGDLSGTHVICSSESRPIFNMNSDSAIRFGFSKGAADTEEQLAKLLGLNEWREVTDIGRTIAERRLKLYKQLTKEIPRILERLQHAKDTERTEEIINGQIKDFQSLLDWSRRDPLLTVLLTGLYEKDIVKILDILQLRLDQLKSPEQSPTPPVGDSEDPGSGIPVDEERSPNKTARRFTGRHEVIFKRVVRPTHPC